MHTIKKFKKIKTTNRAEPERHEERDDVNERKRLVLYSFLFCSCFESARQIH
jgi:hypothetical protein